MLSNNYLVKSRQIGQTLLSGKNLQNRSEVKKENLSNSKSFLGTTQTTKNKQISFSSGGGELKESFKAFCKNLGGIFGGHAATVMVKGASERARLSRKSVHREVVVQTAGKIGSETGEQLAERAASFTYNGVKGFSLPLSPRAKKSLKDCHSNF